MQWLKRSVRSGVSPRKSCICPIFRWKIMLLYQRHEFLCCSRLCGIMSLVYIRYEHTYMQTIRTSTLTAGLQVGVKWRVKFWFSCWKLPTKLKSWKSRDKMSSAEMVGIEQLLPWDLSRRPSVSSFPACVFTGPNLFRRGWCWSSGSSAPSSRGWACLGGARLLFPVDPFWAVPPRSALSAWVLVFHRLPNCSGVLPLYPRTLNI